MSGEILFHCGRYGLDRLTRWLARLAAARSLLVVASLLATTSASAERYRYNSVQDEALANQGRLSFATSSMSDIQQFQNFREALEDPEAHRDLQTYRRTLSRYMMFVEQHLGPASGILACYSYHNFAVMADAGGDARTALTAIARARAGCRDARYSAPLILAALDAEEGTALQSLGRDTEARVLLDRAVTSLRALEFPDPQVSARAVISLARNLSKNGDQRGARTLLLEVKRVADRQNSPEALDARLDLLLALSQNAAERSVTVEASSWARHAQLLMDSHPALREEHQMQVSQQFASTNYSRFGSGGGASQTYATLLADLERRRADPNHIAYMRATRAIYLLVEGRLEDAATEIQLLRTAEPNLRFNPDFRRGYLQLMLQYYSSIGDCTGSLRYSELLLNLVNGSRSYARFADTARNSRAFTLSTCGRAREGIELLRRNSPNTRSGDWETLTGRWALSLVYEAGGDHSSAVGELRPICEEMDRRTASRIRGVTERRYSIEPLTLSAASCYQDLAGALYGQRQQANPVGTRISLNGPYADIFYAAQRAIQTDLDDGVSFSLGQAAARRRGPQAAAMVVSFETIQREIATAQRTLEDRMLIGNAQLDPVLDARLSAMRVEAERLQSQINTVFPEYWIERSPQPVQVALLQGSAGAAPILHDGEAAVLFLLSEDPRQQSFVFAVSRRDSAAARITVPYRRIRDLVEQLRGQIQRSEDGASPEPYDLRASYELFTTLFGDARIQEVIGPARVLSIVTSGAMKRLPFAVLTTAAPTTPLAASRDQLREAPWLLRRHAIAMYPTLSALVRLRQVERTAAPSRTFIAFADPDVSLVRRIAALDAPPTSGSMTESRSFASPAERSTEASTESGYPELRDLAPQGTNEMLGVAAILRANRDSVVTGPAANERYFKQMDTSGQLAQFRVLGFATHGVLPGNTGLLWEPALVLSIPRAGDAEDGLLTASEIAGLHLNADLVLLSACNTGSEDSGRSLVALSRAFLQAGARSLIVTHWRVRNDLGPVLMPAMISWQLAHPEQSSAEALREAALAVMQNDEIEGAHPAQWAAYVLVGDANWSRLTQ